MQIVTGNGYISVQYTQGKCVMWPKGFPRRRLTVSKDGYSSYYCYVVLHLVDLGETYLDVLFETVSNISGFIHYDSGVRSQNSLGSKL